MPKRGAAFRTAQQLDPNCAMCFWGEALVLGPNINAPMDAAAVQPALAALAQGQVLAAGASEQEQALIEALAARYSADPAADRATRSTRPMPRPCRRSPSASRTISTSPSSTRKR